MHFWTGTRGSPILIKSAGKRAHDLRCLSNREERGSCLRWGVTLPGLEAFIALNTSSENTLVLLRSCVQLPLSGRVRSLELSGVG